MNSGDRTPCRVVLVCMPWTTPTRPSLALGILGRICAEVGVEAHSLYPNIDMASAIGLDPANQLANNRLLGGLSEHLFACDLFGAQALESDALFKTVAGSVQAAPFSAVRYLRWLRDDVVPPFLDALVARITRLAPTVVGLTATFNQVMGSLAVASRLKREAPGTSVILGGACFDGEMGIEYHRAMPAIIDHVFTGEADESFREYLRRCVAGGAVTQIPGVTWYDGSEVKITPGDAVRDMARVPVPDYDGYFAERDRVRAVTGFAVPLTDLPFESSRGCWWGQNKHCVFCGINDSLMSFREKSVDRVVGEMISLSERYRTVHLSAADWIISKRSRRALFAAMREHDLDLDCFYEARADMGKEEVAEMKAAGVARIQPGIESFSSELLSLMSKHTTRIRHVQFLRWCHEYGIEVSYNLLYGFPDERPSWYLDMSRFLPRIVHLPPPELDVFPVEMHRFSPLFEQRAEFGVTRYEIRADYRHNFPPEMVDTPKIGYFFSYQSDRLADPNEYLPEFAAAVRAWRTAWTDGTRPACTYRIGPGFVEVRDHRDQAERSATLTGLAHDVFLLCDRIQSRRSLGGLLARREPGAAQEADLEVTVAKLTAANLLMAEGDLLLSLPTAETPRLTETLYERVLGAGAHVSGGESGRQLPDSGAALDGRNVEWIHLASKVPGSSVQRSTGSRGAASRRSSVVRSSLHASDTG